MRSVFPIIAGRKKSQFLAQISRSCCLPVNNGIYIIWLLGAHGVPGAYLTVVNDFGETNSRPQHHDPCHPVLSLVPSQIASRQRHSLGGLQYDTYSRPPRLRRPCPCPLIEIIGAFPQMKLRPPRRHSGCSC